MKHLDGFTASANKPAEWASLIKQSGAKYVPSPVCDEYMTVAVMVDGNFGK